MRISWHMSWLVALAGTACSLNPQPDLPADRSGSGSASGGRSGINLGSDGGATPSTGNSGGSAGAVGPTSSAGASGVDDPAVGSAGEPGSGGEAGVAGTPGDVTLVK